MTLLFSVSHVCRSSSACRTRIVCHRSAPLARGGRRARPPLARCVGNVTDESGGAVPGATITATEVRTNISRTAVSNATGNYTFTNLAPGVYRVEGELVGFRKFSRDRCRSQRQHDDSRGHRADGR